MTRDDLKMKLPHAEGEDVPDAEEDVEERLALESLQRHRRARRRKKVIAAGVVGGIVVAAGIAWAVLTSASSQPAEEARFRRSRSCVRSSPSPCRPRGRPSRSPPWW